MLIYFIILYKREQIFKKFPYMENQSIGQSAIDIFKQLKFFLIMELILMEILQDLA